MMENWTKDKSIVWALMAVMTARIRRLSWVDRWRVVYFCMSFAMITGRVENEHSGILIGLAVNLLVAYEQIRRRNIVDKLITDDDLNNTKDKKMEEKNTESLQGLFSGAVLNEPQIVIAQSGSQVTYKKMETASGEKPKAGDERVVLPEVLRTPQAEALLVKLLDAGVLDAGWQPIGLSLAEKGTLVEYIAQILCLRNQWKLFGTLWGSDGETLRTSKSRGLEQDKTWKFRDRLNAL